jgi:hypothetical protein
MMAFSIMFSNYGNRKNWLPVRSGNPGRLENGGGVAGGKRRIHVQTMALRENGTGIPDMNGLYRRLENDGHQVSRLVERETGVILGV